MKSSKKKILPAAVAVVALIASVAAARAIHTHKTPLTAQASDAPALGANAVYGSDGRFLGVAPDESTRAEMKALLDIHPIDRQN